MDILSEILTLMGKSFVELGKNLIKRDDEDFKEAIKYCKEVAINGED